MLSFYHRLKLNIALWHSVNRHLDNIKIPEIKLQSLHNLSKG